MSESYSIEVADEIVGLIVRYNGENRFRFHAATKAVHAMDGHLFCKPRDAERAARMHTAHLHPTLRSLAEVARS